MESMKNCTFPFRARLLRVALALALVALAAGCAAGKGATAAQGPQGKAVATPAQLAAQNQLVDAKTLQLTGNAAAAEAQLRTLLAQEPRCAAACYELARLMAADQQVDSALHYAQRAVGLEGGNVWYRLLLASLYEATGQHDRQAQQWEAIVTQRPEQARYYYELSNAYARAGHTSQAVGTLNRLQDLVGVTEEVSLRKQALWLQAGKEKEAIAEVEALAQAMPHDKKYHSILAETYMKAGNLKKAKQQYDQVLAQSPDDEYIHISLAQYYKAAGDHEQAYQELKTGFAHPALDCKTKVRVLTSFYTPEEFHATLSKYAYDLLEDAVAHCADSGDFALLHGEALMRQRRYGEAARKFAGALAADSTRYEVWEAMLICLISDDSVTAQLASYARRAQALFPMHTLPYYAAATAAYRDKDFGKASNLLQRAELQGFTNGYLQRETYMMLVECYHEMGDIHSAHSYAQAALDLNPDDTIVLNNISYYLIEDEGWQEYVEEALEMIERAVELAPNNATFLDTYAWVLFKMGRYQDARKQMEKCLRLSPNPSDTLKEHWRQISERAQ